jgi:Fur family ferric uptake transcriptional regulator|tara:strand:- start:7872 stop:8276 length:405 start_codon:yes stop_codon:yes gene_type:complete
MQQRKELRQVGLKVTLPRIKILEILETSSDPHMSAEDIYKLLIKEGEDIGLATVYRVLTQFETAGLVTRHSFEGGHSVFELDYGENHDHMVNVDTGEAVCFKSDALAEVQRAIANEHGFEILDHSLVLYVKEKK